MSVARRAIFFSLLASIAAAYTGYMTGLLAGSASRDRYWSTQFASYQNECVAREAKRDREAAR